MDLIVTISVLFVAGKISYGWLTLTIPGGKLLIEILVRDAGFVGVETDTNTCPPRCTRSLFSETESELKANTDTLQQFTRL